MTPSQLLEIRRVRAMASSAPNTPENNCFRGEKGETGQQGPPGEKGNYGIPASLGYFNDSAFPQVISNSIATNANNMGTIVRWANVDLKFSQGTTGLGYSDGKFYNQSATDDILLNVSGFISFFPNTSGTRSVYARLSGINADIYGYTQVDAVNTPGAATVVPFSFNIFLKANIDITANIGPGTFYNYFEILVIQTATPAGTSLTINNSTSRISMTRINTSMKGDTGAAGLTASQINTQITNEITTVGITAIVNNLLTSPTFTPKTFGNVLIVDNLFGSTGNVNSLYQTYMTIESAISTISAGGLTNKTIWLLPGTYTLSGSDIIGPVAGKVGITIPDNCSIRGMSAQTVKIKMENVVTNHAMMILMGENTRIEDCTLELTSTLASDLTGILFSGTSAFTSKIKGCMITINNYNVPNYTNVTGILANGTGPLNTSLALEQAKGGSLTCIEDSTIQILSNNNGIKRGILVGGGTPSSTNIVNIRNTNIFVRNPASSLGLGSSYCAVENNSPTSIIQCFNCVICGPTTGSIEDFSDISQSQGEIVIGEGTTLVNKKLRLTSPGAQSGSFPFKLITNTTTLFYAALGNINDFTVNLPGYLLPGTMMIQDYLYPAAPAAPVYNFKYPSTNIPSTCYIVPKKSILMSTKVRLGKQQSTSLPLTPSSPTFQLFVRVYKDTIPVTALTGSIPTELFTIILTHTDTEQTYPNSTNPQVFVLEEGSQLRVSMSYTGGTTNAGEDLYVQLELY